MLCAGGLGAKSMLPGAPPVGGYCLVFDSRHSKVGHREICDWLTLTQRGRATVRGAGLRTRGLGVLLLLSLSEINLVCQQLLSVF